MAVRPRVVRRQSMPGVQQMQTQDVDNFERRGNVVLSDALRIGQSLSERLPSGLSITLQAIDLVQI